MNLTRTFFVASVLFFSMISGTVFAADTSKSSRNTPVPVPDTVRLKDGTMQSCQVRETAIKTRSEHLVQLAATMGRVFDSIASRVETYYTTKVLPGGKIVVNYDVLVADIQKRKDGVQQALFNVQSDILAFSCTTDNPKQHIVKFNNDMRVVKSALGLYRTSVRKLIVAVHSVVGEENSATSSAKLNSSPKGNTEKRN